MADDVTKEKDCGAPNGERLSTMWLWEMVNWPLEHRHRRNGCTAGIKRNRNVKAEGCGSRRDRQIRIGSHHFSAACVTKTSARRRGAPAAKRADGQAILEDLAIYSMSRPKISHAEIESVSFPK
jgi:hypothetical protein